MRRSEKPNLTDDQIMLLRTAGRSSIALWPFLLDPGKRFGGTEIGKALGIKRSTAADYLEALTPVFLVRDSFHGGYTLKKEVVEKLLGHDSTVPLIDSTTLIIINKVLNTEGTNNLDSVGKKRGTNNNSHSTVPKTDSVGFDEDQVVVIDLLRKNKIMPPTSHEIARLEFADQEFVAEHLEIMNYEISLNDNQSKYAHGRVVQQMRGGGVPAWPPGAEACEYCGGRGSLHVEVIAITTGVYSGAEKGEASLKGCPNDPKVMGHKKIDTYGYTTYPNTPENIRKYISEVVK